MTLRLLKNSCYKIDHRALEKSVLLTRLLPFDAHDRVSLYYVLLIIQNYLYYEDLDHNILTSLYSK